MSLLPIIFSDHWDDVDRPLRMLERDLFDCDDFFDFGRPRNAEVLLYRPSRRFRQAAARRYRPYNASEKNRSTGAVARTDPDKFQVTLDLQEFQPEEIRVKVVGDSLVVDGKHEEKEDDHGWISRQFSRKYRIPQWYDIDQVNSSLSTDGVLTITAPMKRSAIDVLEAAPAKSAHYNKPNWADLAGAASRTSAIEEKKERIIEIERTGKPAIQDKSRAADQKSVKDKGTEATEKSDKKIAAA